MDMTFKNTRLSDKALSVKLTIKRAAMVKRDDALTAGLQATQNDSGLTVLTKLFRDKTSPVYTIMQAVGEVYTYHVNNTLPYVDAGPRLLPSGVYFDYSNQMRERIDRVEGLLRLHMPDYDNLVAADVAYRNQGRAAGHADAIDYPTADEFRGKMAFDLKFMPLPDESHPLFDLSDADKASFQDHVTSVAAQARNDVIRRMLDPLAHLVDKLNTPIGAEKSVFRDSAIENVLEGCRMAKKLMLEEDVELTARIDELSQVVTGYAFGLSQLRDSPDTRSAAAIKLDAMKKAMEGYFGS